MSIPIRFREVRRALGYKQYDFGRNFGLSQDAISAIETGRNNPTIKTLTLLYKTFKVDLGWLLTGEGEMFRK